jgi:hypothetical protein
VSALLQRSLKNTKEEKIECQSGLCMSLRSPARSIELDMMVADQGCNVAFEVTKEIRPEFLQQLPLHICDYPPCYFLQTQFPEDLVRHVLVLPSTSCQALELYSMQGEEWDFDDEDLEFENHAAAKFALDMCARLADGTS